MKPKHLSRLNKYLTAVHISTKPTLFFLTGALFGVWRARAGCQRYPPPKVHSMCFNINYTKGQRCHKINVPLSVVQQACLFCCLEFCQLDKQDSCCFFSAGKRQTSVEPPPRCSCMCVVPRGTARVAGGRMVILSPQMDRKSPGGASEKPQAM